MIEALNSLDGDAKAFDNRMFVTFGNHEFDISTCTNSNPSLNARVAESQFTWLAANLDFPHCDGMKDMLERSNTEQFAAQIRALLARPDAGPLLPGITCPTLVLTGREDLWSPPEQHQRMAETIPGAQLCIVEQCAHMSTLEQPQAVNAAFARWLLE